MKGVTRRPRVELILSARWQPVTRSTRARKLFCTPPALSQQATFAMTTTAEAFQLAFRHHQAGQLREAEAIYRGILQREPEHVDALHLLGLVAYQVRRYDLAIDLIAKAVRLSGDRALFHGNLGEAYRSAGKLGEAEQHLRRALQLDPNLPDVYSNLGNVLRATDRPDEAIAAFRQALRLKASFPEAHNNLGTVLQMQGDLAGAVSQYEHALRLNPRYAQAHNNLGTARTELGQAVEAIASFRQALAIMPHYDEAVVNLAAALQSQHQFAEAESLLREVLARNPSSSAAWIGLGTLLKENRRYEEAIDSLNRALAIDPASHEAHYNLGTVYHVQQQWGPAGEAYQRALAVRPDFARALSNLATVRQHQGDAQVSLALYDRAIALDPIHAQSHLNRANVYKMLRRTADAIAGYERAIQLQPRFPEAFNNLAALYNDLSRPDDAIACCQRGIEQDPTSAALFANLATSLQNLGRVDEAIEASRKSVELRPEGVNEHTNLLYKLNFNPRYAPAEIFAEHLEWARRHAEPLTAKAVPCTNDRSPERRLRVGYVSPYFRDHAVNFFSEPMIVAHDHRQVEVYCYNDSRLADEATTRLRSAADHWRDTRLQSDDELAKSIRDDAIDILVDLTGHIAGNRLLVFARKPAPVQVTYLGYQNTTGMSAMDYRLTDAWADPPGETDPYYTEKLVRLGASYFCYRPSDDASAITPLPALDRGYVTFGSFNNFAKVAPPVLDAWIELLARVPNSRLMILAHRGGYLQNHLDERMQQRGLDPARIELCTKRPRNEYLELVSRADIALDPFPFNGHTTTCDAVWMGLPVVMLAGGSYASRFGGSVLRNVGLSDLIATSAAEYVELAARLAGDIAALAEIRSGLRQRMAASVLCDASGFAHRLEGAYREMWRRWCAGQPPQAIG